MVIDSNLQIQEAEQMPKQDISSKQEIHATHIIIKFLKTEKDTHTWPQRHVFCGI